MPSTYTTSGIELIGAGEQTGTWGGTTNDNLQILDRMVSQAGTISLSGTTHTLTISDGILSDGQYAVLVFGGSPSGTNTVTISPNDAKRLWFVKNSSGQSVILTQGSGGNVTVANGKTAVVYCDGGGSGAAVVELTGALSGVLLTSDIDTTVQGYDAGLADIAGLAVTNGNFIVGDGTNWVVESGDTAIASLGVTATAAELNTLDGITATTAELNILDGVTATATEINLLDGLTGKTGADEDIVTGTAGTDGDIVKWNADGDLVSYGAAAQSQATWEAGTDTTESLVSPAKVKAAVEALAPASFPAPDYESAELTVNNGSGGALAHGLGVIPSLIKVVAVCKVGEDGYTAGMEVDISNTQPTWTSGTPYSVGVVVAADATNITYRQGSTQAFGVMNLSTGSNTFITEANWRLVIRAWA